MRVAVVAGPDAGHALPAIGVAAALHARGHTVRMLTGENHRATAAAHGLTVEALPLLPSAAQDTDIGHRLWHRAGEMAVPLAERLGGWGPDLVVADTLTRGGAFAAGLLGRPWVELVPHHLPDPAPDLPPVGLGRRPARTPWRRADDRRLHRHQARSVAAGARQADEVAAGLGLTRRAGPVLRLVATLPSLERPRRDWPRDAHVVGPLAVEPALPDVDLPPGDAPLVVVTDSTAAGAESSIADVALRGLAGLDLRLVVTSHRVAPRTDATVTVGIGPHAPLLAGAAVAVAPGGGGFLVKAAARGVPQVVVPVAGDQLEAAARLRDTGAGRVVPARRLTPRRLRWAVVRQLVDPDARAASLRLAAEARALGPAIAADLVEAVLAGARPRATGPATHLGARAG